ncbi:hypothetical protein ACWGKQ_36830 [Streptomyces sp. NPDC054770]
MPGDFIVASEAAVFWCLEMNSGMVPVAGAVQRLAGAAGHHHAARITMLDSRSPSRRRWPTR